MRGRAVDEQVQVGGAHPRYYRKAPAAARPQWCASSRVGSLDLTSIVVELSSAQSGRQDGSGHAWRLSMQDGETEGWSQLALPSHRQAGQQSQPTGQEAGHDADTG